MFIYRVPVGVVNALANCVYPHPSVAGIKMSFIIIQTYFLFLFHAVIKNDLKKKYNGIYLFCITSSLHTIINYFTTADVAAN